MQGNRIDLVGCAKSSRAHLSRLRCIMTGDLPEMLHRIRADVHESNEQTRANGGPAKTWPLGPPNEINAVALARGGIPASLAKESDMMIFFGVAAAIAAVKGESFLTGEESPNTVGHGGG